MRHQIRGRKLGRTSSHRKAMFRNQLSSLVRHGRIVTTVAKAKDLRPIIEKCITQGKRGTVHARRIVRTWLPDRKDVKLVFDELAPRMEDRQGGYTRVLKLGPRKGDGAEMAIIEFVDYDEHGSLVAEEAEA